jgi:CubicO group peptidase (beta-lactamase class C family)
MPFTRRQVEDAAAMLRPLLTLRAIYDRVPGMAFGLAHDGTTVLLGAHGYADEERGVEVDPATTTFRCASITKSFTATVAMRLIERGRLRLDDPVTTLLPWAKSHLSRDLTVRHLLMHAGSIIRDGSNAWEGPLMPDVATIKKEVVDHGAFGEPSERFRYSNIAYVMLGEIIEQRSGRTFASLVRSEVARPLGLVSTWSDLTPTSRRNLANGYWVGRPGEPDERAEHAETRAIAPAGGLVSRVPDLLEYQHAHLPGDDRLLSEYSKREMQRPQWQRATEPHYGLGWMNWHVNGVNVVGHSGGFPGFTTKIGFAPSEGLAAVMLTNGSTGTSALALDLTYHVLACVRKSWDRSAASTRWHTRGSLAPYAGIYRLHGSDLLVARVNGSLFVLGTDEAQPFATAMRLEPAGRQRFKVVEGFDFSFLGEHVTFLTDRRGRPTALRIGSHLWERATS